MVVSFENPAVQSYIVYSAILALKLFYLPILIGYQRTTKKVFANPEDAATAGGKVFLNDPEIERVRRAHLNDLENIPAFWLLGALYVTTNPVAAWATLLFRVYTLDRILHTIIYVFVVLPQPGRFLAHVISLSIKCYMAIQVIMYYITAL